MINTADILEFITKKVKTKYEGTRVYFDETKDTYELPAFFASISQPTFERDTKNFNNNVMEITLAYRQKKISTADQLDKYEDIKKLFYKGLEMENLHIPVISITMDYTGEYNDIMVITIRIEMIENCTEPDTEELITNLKVNTNYKLKGED